MLFALVVLVAIDGKTVIKYLVSSRESAFYLAYVECTEKKGRAVADAKGDANRKF